VTEINKEYPNRITAQPRENQHVVFKIEQQVVSEHNRCFFPGLGGFQNGLPTHDFGSKYVCHNGAQGPRLHNQNKIDEFRHAILTDHAAKRKMNHRKF